MVTFDLTRNNYPPRIRKFLDIHKGTCIDELYVARRPIWKAIEIAINIAMLNKLNKYKRKMNYDYLFHTFFIIKLKGSDVKYVIEKNQVVTLNKYDEDMYDKYIPIELSSCITIDDFLIKPLMMYGHRILDYEPVSLNCQQFLADVLRANNLLTPNIYEFIKQDISKVLSYFPRTVGSLITRLASGVDVLLHGKSLAE